MLRLSLMSLLLLAMSAARAVAAPPNVVLILADDLGWSDLGCQGSTYYETPHIDRLATEGMRFTRYYTSPNCVPSRAALMTGQYAPRTGMYTVGESERGEASKRKLKPPINVEDLPLDRKTIADVLKGAGYATGMFGKWHLGPGEEHHPAKRGFNEALASQGKHFKFVTRPPVEHADDAYHGDFMTDRAVDFISRNKSRPFFLYLPHFLVHSPIDPKPELGERWKKKPPSGTHWNPDYAAMIQSLDESVGHVMRALEAARLADNTLVIFSSDNGGVGGYHRTEAPSKNRGITDNAPLSGGKGTLREGGVRVPFIARWPEAIPARAVCETPITHVDLMPTLASLAGAALPEQTIDGVDLSPLLRNATATLPRDALFLHFPVYLESYVHDDGWRTTPGSFIIAGDWKLIEYFEDGRKELYHLGEDIGETRNLIDAQPEMARKLHDRLAGWRSDVNAAMPEPVMRSE